MVVTNFSSRVVLEICRCRSKRWMTESMTGKDTKLCKIKIQIELFPYRSDSSHTLHAQIPANFRPFPQAPATHSLQHAHFEDIKFSIC